MTRKEIRTAFISYRRLDTDALAGRLRDRLREALPDWIVFMDVYSITPGVDFRVAVRDALTQSSLFFLLIGRNFLGAGTNRLLEADDTVAYEIKVALDLDLRIIPILVNDATMPRPEDFPLEVRQVVYRSAIDVRHSRFDDDLHHLVQVAAGTPPAKGEAFARGGQKPHANFTQASLRVTKLAIVGGLLGTVLALIILVIVSQMTDMAASEWIGDSLIATGFVPAAALIGAVAMLLLSRRR